MDMMSIATMLSGKGETTGLFGRISEHATEARSIAQECVAIQRDILTELKRNNELLERILSCLTRK